MPASFLVNLRFFFFCGLLLFFPAGAAGQDLQNLADQISSGKTEEKRDALARIRSLQSAAASRLAIAALNDADEVVRAMAASALVFLPPDEASALLVPLLADRAEFVRREAAYAIGRVGPPATPGPLLQLLQREKILEVKTAAVIALGQIGNPVAVDTLVAILQRRPVEDEEFLRRSAARAVGRIAQFIQTGRSDVLTPQNFLPEKYKDLEKPKYPQLAAQFPAFRNAVAVLIRVLQNRNEASDTRREAAFALGAIGDPRAVPALEASLRSEDYFLAEICREALRKISLSTQAETTD